MSSELPLAGAVVRRESEDTATLYAGTLLAALGATASGSGPVLAVAPSPGSGAADWAASGAKSLTGRPDGPPLDAPGGPATAARAALLALDAIAGPLGVAGHELLGERAAVLGLSRRGPWSAGGACRAVCAADGWVAVSLSREDDRAAVSAIVGTDAPGDPWDDLDTWARHQSAATVADRAQLLGVPAGVVPSSPVRCWPPWRISSQPGGALRSPPRVLDLSALWAGPLCGSLMQRAGADVVRVETAQRPDGGRAHPAFDDLLHGGQPSVVVDPATPDLRALVRQADVVITSGRPRALAGLGLDPAARLAERPGVWVSVTAYPDADRVGFGDDTAMAAGLVCHDAGVPLPCGDAIADPLTGVHAALAAWACVLAGGRHHVRLNLRDVAASTLLPAPAAAHPVAEPRARSPLGRARALGADTRDVLTAWGCR